MNKAGGFIAIHRQILEWEWYKDIGTKVLFLHLLLTANFTDGRFEGRIIKRGQVATSQTMLATGTSLSVQQVRTALDHLKITGEITVEQQARYSVITIVKYDQYQRDNRVGNRQSTGNQQADNRLEGVLPTGNQQQYNNNNNNNNNGTMEQYTLTESMETVPEEMFDLFWKEYPNRVAKQNALKAWKKLKMNPELLGSILNGLSRWKASDEWQRDGGRYIPHPATWLNGRRWEDEVKPKASSPAPAPVRQLPANNFEQRDYSDVPDDMMRQLATDMRRFQETGEV